ncbi:MAG: T9SS C-terminal target domain-containing protein [Calditrichaeota bacterium]|nr:MAG: T9SS C-terminal target domain-containing protein [Calditrichota bacterium]
MNTKKLLSLVLASSTAMIFSNAFATAKIDKPLSDELERVGSNELVNAYVVLDDRITYTDLMEMLEREGLQNLNKFEKRPFIKRTLKEFAKNEQREILSFLERNKELGSVSKLVSLWTNNVVAFSATKDVILELANFDKIGRISFDKTYIEEELTDFKPDPIPKNIFTLNPTFNDTNPGLIMIRAHEVWEDLGYHGAGVVVANLDSGTDYEHPDLGPNIWNNLGEDADGDGVTMELIGGVWSFDPGDLNGVDDDNNGYTDDLVGWNMGNNNNDPQGSSSHGTSTAGQVCGNGANGTITGVAPQANCMILQVTGGQTSFWEAQQYAMDKDADVITSSYSYKFNGSSPDYAMFRQNTDMELALGIIHTNSTSNNGNNTGNEPIPYNISAPGNSPPPWIHPDQTLVGGLSSVIGSGNINVNTGIIESSSPHGPAAWEDIQANHPGYPYTLPSNYHDYPYETQTGAIGLLKPDVSSPGASTQSTLPGGGYGSFGGTSSATPHLAGVCALMLSASPTLTPADISKFMQLTSVDLGAPGKDPRYGAGMVDAYEAVSAVAQPIMQGYLTDANGNIIPNASVKSPSTLAHTDSTGFYQVRVPADTIQTVTFYKYGFDFLTKDVFMTTLDTLDFDTTLVASQMGSFVGTVTDEVDQSPVEASLEVNIYVFDEEMSIETTTDANGNFAFPSIPMSQTGYLEYVSTTVKPPFNYSEKTFEDIITVTAGGNTQETYEVPRTDLILVDDDGGDNLESIYITALDNLGLRYFIWDVEEFGEISADTLNSLFNRNVIWFTGYQQNTDVLTTDNLTALESFLNQGGNILLSGTSVGNSVSGLNFGNNFVGALIDPIGTTNSFVKGTTHPVGDTKLYNVSVPTQSNKDGFTLAGGEAVISYGVTGNFAPAVVANTGNNWSVVLTGFEASGIYDLNGNPSLSTLDTFLGNVYNWWGTLTDIRELDLTAPISYSLAQNYPNPFNPSTKITFTLPQEESLKIFVYNVKGQLVKTLFDSKGNFGFNSVVWNGTDDLGKSVSSGIYFYKLETASGFSEIKKMTFLK